jgi:hypothetical protein
VYERGVKELTSLTELTIIDYFVIGLVTLRSFTNLRVLKLCRTYSITNSHLPLLTHLTELDLEDVYVITGLGISQLVNLKTRLDYPRDIAICTRGIGTLTNLTELNLGLLEHSFDATHLNHLTKLTSIGCMTKRYERHAHHFDSLAEFKRWHSHSTSWCLLM